MCSHPRPSENLNVRVRAVQSTESESTYCRGAKLKPSHIVLKIRNYDLSCIFRCKLRQELQCRHISAINKYS